jgi:NADH:ubiquinone oxidoreductase subunit B-like Fe-S oxidoreductase
LGIGKEGEVVLIEIGPPTAEALIQGIFGLQRRIRRNKGLRMWYRK